MLEIWGRKNSGNVQPVMWTVGELGLEYERHNVGGSFGGLDDESYGKLNPNRTIPTVRDDNRVLWESQTIIRYLCSEYGVGSLWPADSYQRALADQWLEWSKGTAWPRFVPVWIGFRTPADKRDPKAMAAGATAFGDALRIVDRQLESSPYVAGEDLTMGDITLGAWAYKYFTLDIERPSLPNVESWYARLCDRPAYQKHVMIPFGSTPEEWLELEKAGAND